MHGDSYCSDSAIIDVIVFSTIDNYRQVADLLPAIANSSSNYR